MTANQAILLAAALLGLGFWLMLPRGAARGRLLGAVLAVVAVAGATTVGIVCNHLPLIGHWTSSTVFFVLAGITVVAGVAAVTLRSPAYCALWFAMALLGTAGLFLLQGAEFLALATVVVYAGAIVVTFLFVLMLAQPEGHAFYDRLSWEAGLSAFSGALIVGVLAMTLNNALTGAAAAGGHGERADGQEANDQAAAGQEANPQAQAERMPLPPSATAAQRGEEILNADHVARLGGRLFSEHLIAVQVAGLLLMVALIAATTIVTYGRDLRTMAGQHGAVDETFSRGQGGAGL